MENVFYAPPESFEGDTLVRIEGQEAQHISRVLRNKAGDEIFVADGEGSRYQCVITEVSKKAVTARCVNREGSAKPAKDKILALGIIKKRDRLEFAIEKAVELGATRIILFNSDHSQRNKINEDRMELIIQSAFKQSGRFWLPALEILDSLEAVLSNYEKAHFIMAHEEVPADQKPEALSQPVNIFFIGPEGGFSEREVDLIRSKEGELISLGRNRLRAETAVAACFSQYLYE